MINLSDFETEKPLIKFTAEYKTTLFLNRPNEREFLGYYFEHDGFFGYIRSVNNTMTYFIRSNTHILVRPTLSPSLEQAKHAVADYLNVIF